MGKSKYAGRKAWRFNYDHLQQNETWLLRISVIPPWKDDWIFNQGCKMKDVLIRNRYEKVCNEYVAQLCSMWNREPSYGWWVHNYVGGVWCYGDFISLNMDDIVYIVNNNIQEEDVVNWLDYASIAARYELDCPNLKSWINGFTGLSEEEIKKLQKPKKNMDYKIGDKVNVTANSITIGKGVVESIEDESYVVKLDNPITTVYCMSCDLEYVVDNGESKEK